MDRRGYGIHTSEVVLLFPLVLFGDIYITKSAMDIRIPGEKGKSIAL